MVQVNGMVVDARTLPAEVQTELTRAQSTLTEAMARAKDVAATMVESSRRQQEELAALRARYDALNALTQGQEQIAQAHRRILSPTFPSPLARSDPGLLSRNGPL